MEFIVDFILHIDQHMVEMVRNYHEWTYAILFLIIFCETGLVVTPFLPGDSLLFVAGAIAAQLKVCLGRERESRRRFEQGDLAWRDHAHRSWASRENALLAL